MGRGHHKVLAEEEAAASSVLAVVHVQLQQRHVGPRVRRRLVAPDDSTCVAWGGGFFYITLIRRHSLWAMSTSALLIFSVSSHID